MYMYMHDKLIILLIIILHLPWGINYSPGGVLRYISDGDVRMS